MGASRGSSPSENFMRHLSSPAKRRGSATAIGGALALTLNLTLGVLPAHADSPGTNNVFQLDNTRPAAGPFPGFVFGGEGVPVESDDDNNGDDDGGLRGAFQSIPNAPSIVPASGMLDAPYYRSSAAGNPFFGLTYYPPEGIPLSFALGVGTGNGIDWHRNEKLIYSQACNSRECFTPDDFEDDDDFDPMDAGSPLGELFGDVNPATTTLFAVTDQTIVAGASVGTGQHHRGPGTLTVEGKIGFTGGPVLDVKHVYALLAGRNYLEVTTTIRNTSGTAATNVNMWVGTSDDYIGDTDSPNKIKGQIQGSANTALFNAACSGSTNAIIVSSGAEYAMVYSPAEGADTVLSDGYGNWNTRIVNLAPADSEYEVLDSDGSYALYLPFGDIANGASKTINWYFEGGELTFPVPENCADSTPVGGGGLEEEVEEEEEEVEDVPAPAPAPAAAPAAPVSLLTLVCSPDPVAVGGLVTCVVSGGDGDIDILWAASSATLFAGQGVRLDGSGNGVFSFRAPSGAQGQAITVELVDWDRATTVQVTGRALPARIPAGEGQGGLPLAVTLSALVLLAGAGAMRMRRAGDTA
jgi:hypothetical protein